MRIVHLQYLENLLEYEREGELNESRLRRLIDLRNRYLDGEKIKLFEQMSKHVHVDQINMFAKNHLRDHFQGLDKYTRHRLEGILGVTNRNKRKKFSKESIDKLRSLRSLQRILPIVAANHLGVTKMMFEPRKQHNNSKKKLVNIIKTKAMKKAILPRRKLR